MNFLRRLFSFLVLPAIIALIIAITALLPPVQTWFAQWQLGRIFGPAASVGSVTARFGEVEITDLHLEYEGAIFSAPTLKAKLPILSSAWNRSLAVETLDAKGWTLTLSGTAPNVLAPANGFQAGTTASYSTSSALNNTSAVDVERRFRGLLNRVQLPFGLSLDSVTLDGDVLVPFVAGKAPTLVHVAIKGGGLASGREGAFVIEASGTSIEPIFHVVDLTTHARLSLTMDSPRTIARAGLKVDLAAKIGSPIQEVALNAQVSVIRQPDEETYDLNVTREGRQVASIQARLPASNSNLSGNWKIDWRDQDQTPFTPARPLPTFVAAGEGTFETDALFAQTHATGKLTASLSHLETIAPSLASVGAATLATDFDLIRQGSLLRVERLDVALAGARPIATISAQQPFEFDLGKSALTATRDASDLMSGKFTGLPLGWLPGLPGGLVFTAGEISGDYTVRAEKGAITLLAKTPFTATQLTLARDGLVLARGLDLSATLHGGTTQQGWNFAASPLTVTSAQRTIATLDVKASGATGVDGLISANGDWKLDLAALADQPILLNNSWITARAASGDFSATLGATTKLAGKLSLLGATDGDSITGAFTGEVSSNRAITFQLPLKIAHGTSVSELSVEGTWWNSGKSGSRYTLRFGGKLVTLDHLRQLAAPAAALVGAPLPKRLSSTTEAISVQPAVSDSIPFWGTGTGRVSLAFDQLQLDDLTLNGVRATFDLDHTSMTIQNGLYVLADKSLGQASGSVTFNPRQEIPYHLKAALDGGEIDAAPLFGVTPPGQDPLIKGRFSVANSLSGQGTSLNDLVAHTQEEFKVKSSNGIVRLLKTTVSNANPEPSAPVTDTLDAVGSTVGAFFGFKHGSISSGEIKLSKNTEAVLELTYHWAEVLYQDLTFTATRGVDGIIRITDFNLVARDDRLTGTGEIAYVKGQPLLSRPLSLDLQFGIRGRIADLLTSTDLLSTSKDDLGYTLFNQPVHFSGSLAKLDKTQWHDRLAAAAIAKPDVPSKKESGKATAKK